MPEHSTGQRSGSVDDPAFRSRARSGFRLGGLSPRLVTERLDELQSLIVGIGGLCLACGPTAAALHGFDG